jgi:hypothetical protein
LGFAGSMIRPKAIAFGLARPVSGRAQVGAAVSSITADSAPMAWHLFGRTPAP